MIVQGWSHLFPPLRPSPMLGEKGEDSGQGNLAHVRSRPTGMFGWCRRGLAQVVVGVVSPGTLQRALSWQERAVGMRDSIEREVPVASFTTLPFYRPVIFGFIAVFGTVGVVLVVVQATSTSGPGWSFVLPWLAVVGWNAYWFLWRFAYRLELTETTLSWRTPLTGGEVPLDRVRAFRPSVFGSGAQALDVRDGRPVLVFGRRGIIDFGRELGRLAPHVHVKFGWQARLVERGWGSGFRPGP
jgi:hypothetical protein